MTLIFTLLVGLVWLALEIVYSTILTRGYGFKLWAQVAATGADLLWRIKTNLRPKLIDSLDDGSWLARIIPTSGAGRSSTEPLTVRDIEYTIDDG